MPHGPQGEGSPKAGSLEILTAADDARDLSTVTHGAPQRSLETLDAEQVNESEEIRFPLRDLDGCIMNAPFTDHMKRGRKFSRAALKAMQRHEIEIRNRLHERDPGAAAVITTNSIRTFFTPLAEKLLRAARWEIDRFHHVRDVFAGDLRKLKASVRELRPSLPDGSRYPRMKTVPLGRHRPDFHPTPTPRARPFFEPRAVPNTTIIKRKA